MIVYSKGLGIEEDYPIEAKLIFAEGQWAICEMPTRWAYTEYKMDVLVAHFHGHYWTAYSFEKFAIERQVTCWVCGTRAPTHIEGLSKFLCL